MYYTIYLHQDAKIETTWHVHIPTSWDRNYPILCAIWDNIGEQPLEFSFTTLDPYITIKSPKGIFCTVSLLAPEPSPISNPF